MIIKKTATDCSVPVLVERQINLSNQLIEDFAKVIEYGQRMKMRLEHIQQNIIANQKYLFTFAMLCE